MNVLVACEESQTVCKAFRQLGFNAFSCDIVECSGEHPEWHFKEDIFDVIKRKGGVTQSGNLVFVDKWDLMIAHPPCTFLSSSGAKWYYHPDDKDLPIEQRRPHPRFPHRKQDQDAAVDFFSWRYTTRIFRILPLRILLVSYPVDSVSQTRLYNRICLVTQHVRPLVYGLRVYHY